MKHERYYGIDPGVKNGVAVWTPATKSLTLTTMTFWEVVTLIEYQAKADAEIVIEASWKLPTYARHRKGATAREIEKISRNAGENHAYGKLIAELCERLGANYRLVTPKRSKLTHQQFTALTGYDKQTNEHTRDAAMLVWGL